MQQLGSVLNGCVIHYVRSDKELSEFHSFSGCIKYFAKVSFLLLIFPSHPLWLDHSTRNCICWSVQVTKLLIMQSSPTSRFIIPHRSRYSPQHPVSKYLQSMFSFNVSKTIVLYSLMFAFSGTRWESIFLPCASSSHYNIIKQKQITAMPLLVEVLVPGGGGVIKIRNGRL
jgi:hypothetical protein